MSELREHYAHLQKQHDKDNKNKRLIKDKDKMIMRLKRDIQQKDTQKLEVGKTYKAQIAKKDKVWA